MKTWFITGISSGLGQALAQSVMENGDFVVGTMRSKTAIAAFNQEFEGKGLALSMELTNPQEIEDVVGHTIALRGQIDVLVNNAGVGFIGAVEEASIAEVRHLMEANFFGALTLTQQVLPHMRTAKAGHIVQISSHGGIKAFAGFGIYNASKFALEGFSEALAQEVASLGIHVTIVEPGPFRTGFAGSGLQEAQQQIEDYSGTAGAFRAKLKGVHGLQEGDPKKAAEAIVNQVNGSQKSLRLPLGKTALATIGMKLQSVQADIDMHQETAKNAVYNS